MTRPIPSLLTAVLLCALALPSAPGASAAAAPVTQCGWPVKADPDLVNVAYPDQSAEYWATPFEATPGSEMTITGRFPLARYMSFHLYEASTPVDALTDYQMQPATGVNPYVPHALRRSNGTYVVHVVLGQRPAHPAPNTLYAASLNGEPNVAGVILYRLYLPQGDATGGVPLPTVQYTSQAGASPLPCPDLSSLDDGTVNQLIAGSSIPADWPAQAPTGSNPTWGISTSHPTANSAGPATVYTGNPFFANFDNVYLSYDAYRDRGAVLAFRAKAPTFTDTATATTMPTAQLRYWSICTNDFPTQRYVACLPDQDMHLDRQGYFNVVISDPAHKPAHLLPTDNWLPAGTYPDMFVLYRQMLPAASFTQAIAAAPSAAAAPHSMGEYFPVTVQCSTAAFDAGRCGLPTAQSQPARSARPHRAGQKS